MKNLIQLIKLLNEWGYYDVGVTGVIDEKEFLNSLYTSDSNFVDLVGIFDLNEFALLLKNASLYISNSTGPLHLGVAMGTKSSGIFPKLTGFRARPLGPVWFR